MAEKEFPSDFDEYAGNDLPYVLIVGFHPVQNKGVRVPIGKIIQGLATTLNPTFTGKVKVPSPNGDDQAYQAVPKFLLDDRVPTPDSYSADKYLRSSDDGTASWVEAINNLSHVYPGGILDARQGKALYDLVKDRLLKSTFDNLDAGVLAVLDSTFTYVVAPSDNNMTIVVPESATSTAYIIIPTTSNIKRITIKSLEFQTMIVIQSGEIDGSSSAISLNLNEAVTLVKDANYTYKYWITSKYKI
jgi:hypothetical protein